MTGTMETARPRTAPPNDRPPTLSNVEPGNGLSLAAPTDHRIVPESEVDKPKLFRDADTEL